MTRSPLRTRDLAALEEALLLTDDDKAALRRAGDLLVPRIEELLDVWYGFVGSKPFLLDSFSTADGPHAGYLAGVRTRFGQWVHDLTRAELDDAWLAQQELIGRRHHREKGQADGVTGTPPVVPFRYMVALVYPIHATVRPFLEQGCDDPAEVERMHQAWLKAVLLSVILWCRPYVEDGTF